MVDPEIVAITQCHEIFEPLEDDSKIRVIQWLISKFQLNTTHSNFNRPEKRIPAIQPEDPIQILPPSESGKKERFADVNPTPNGIADFETLAEFFADTSPKTDWEKVLVVATYLQVKNELTDFSSFQVNKELKNLGHGMTHITHVFDACINRKPQLILQLRKDGKSQQAQKKFKVSGEGIKYVKAMLAKNEN